MFKFKIEELLNLKEKKKYIVSVNVSRKITHDNVKLENYFYESNKIKKLKLYN